MAESGSGNAVAVARRWIDRNLLGLGREMRLSYLPPLMVYVAAGVSGLTAIVGTFYVKERLGLSAGFLAALGFWATLPWSLKMLLGHPEAMREVASFEAWFVLSALLAPVGYVVQDTVADAMTVEAVPRHDARGAPLPEAERRSMHTTMQTLGRVAIIGGTVLVALANVWLLRGADRLPPDAKAALYLHVYELALVIPAVSVLGVMLGLWLRRREAARLAARGLSRDEIAAMMDPHAERPPVNWWILGGGLAFACVSVAVGLGKVPGGQEIVFAASMAIVLFLIRQLTRELEPEARHVLVGTALVVFAFRAMPGPGAGATWWMIDELGFDQQFLATLSLVGSVLTLSGLFIFRRFMAERSIAYIVGMLTVVGTILSLPNIGMYYGLHEWTAAMTGGVVDARAIALVDTALESPLGQIAMVPMLAWIANSAPERLKATFFAVMASFTNLALSASQLGTKYLNEIFLVTRQVTDPAGRVQVPADYGQLGALFIVVTVIGFVVPLLAIAVVKSTRYRSA